LRSFCLSDRVGRVAEDGCRAAGVAVGVEEGCAFDAVVALPVDCKGSVGFFDVERLRVAVAGEREGEAMVAVEEPSIAGVAGEQRNIIMASKQSAAVMVEPTDANLPSLQRMQADAADTKREIEKIHVTLA
jgi:hypothetical protein